MNRSVWVSTIGAVTRYALMSLLIMVVLSLINPGNLPLEVSLFFALFFGIVVGMYRELFGFAQIARWPLLARIVAGLFILQVLVMVAVVLNRIVLMGLHLNITDRALSEILFERAALNFYYKAWIYGLILLFLIELEKALGPGYISDLALGRYNKPKSEERTIMFLDLVDSTKIAEEIGDQKFYDLINDSFRLLSRSILRFRGEVLKYVGDEVIITWKRSGNSLFLPFFLEFRQTLLNKSDFFLEKYGVIPEFKAGVHSGRVVVAYIGEIKKQKDLSGDAMNTAARICGLTSKMESELLISESTYSRLGEEKSHFSGPFSQNVKGKAEPILIYKFAT